MKDYSNYQTAVALNILLHSVPVSQAQMAGSSKYPSVRGNVYFYPFQEGTLVLYDIVGLPESASKACRGRFLGFHVHEGPACTGNEEDPFADAEGHYNPDGCEHPEHAGDLPVMLVDSGNVWGALYTDRFLPEEILGRTVIIHGMADDYRSQPSGDSGMKIACGVVKMWK